MPDLLSDALQGAAVAAAAWVALSIPVALVLGRILHTRNVREAHLR
ncbi:hypothetical protein [Subtercola boreus]|nr:hypothetical protein [Subtercola boreus]TQL52847.1 hypothetical protein FB464_0333 [Subtercola boreus]